MSTTRKADENSNLNERPMTTPSKDASFCGLTTPRSARTSQSTRQRLMTSKTPLLSPTTSTNTIGSQAREAARLAKLQSTAERIHKVSILKEKWAKDKEEKLQRYGEKRSTELKRIHDTSLTLSQQRKTLADKKRDIEAKEKAKVREQVKAFSDDRLFQATEKKRMEQEHRRRSILLNAEIVKKSKEVGERLNAQEKDRQQELLESRRIDHLQVREAKRLEDERRRESMMGRGQAYKERREISQKLESVAVEEEASLLESRRLGWLDTQAAKKAEEESRRQSMAARIEAWRKEKQINEELAVIAAKEDADLLARRAQDAKDVEAYKRDEAARDRLSLAKRLEKWRSERQQESESYTEALEAHEIEIELKRQAAEDLRNYQESLKEARRQSLAYRLDKVKKDRLFDEGQKALVSMMAMEEERLRKQDREDVEAYRQQLRESRRQSLEYRNQREFQERMRQEGEKHLVDDDDRELSLQAWKDVQAYQEQMREERRRSLAQRLVDARKQKEAELTMHRGAVDRLHEELEHRRNEWLDVQAYKRDQASKSRLSIALRVDSWRQTKLRDEKVRERAMMVEEEEARMKEQDWEDLQRAKAELELKQKLDSTPAMIF